NGTFMSQRTDNGFELYGYAPGTSIDYDTVKYENVYYPWEVMRGYDGLCDLISAVQIKFDLKPQAQMSMLFSDKLYKNADNKMQSIPALYRSLPKPSDFPINFKDSILSKLDFDGSELYSYKEYRQLLDTAFDEFVLKNNILSGYPWFGFWGRSALFMLECLLNRKDVTTALKIIRHYGANIKYGLVTNVFREHVAHGNHHSIDASLWFIIRYRQILDLLPAKQKKKEILIAVRYITTILDRFREEKKKFAIRDDCLLELKSGYGDTTWMNAVVEGQPVTNREGAPVEINALWYNALIAAKDICHNIADKELSVFLEHTIPMVKTAAQKFITPGYLADRLEGEIPVEEIRPNAIIACALPHDLFDLETMKHVFSTATEHLLTPYGIRTLSPHDFRFKKKYIGSQFERDQAYHQGSVWSWLLSPYIQLYEKLYADSVPAKERIEAISGYIHKFRNGFMRGHIASVAEIWDGDRPHFPKGSPCYAPGVAAVLTAEQLIDSIRKG
ncbi:MAG: amylo-alpha-1,6-glucosidase, partial [Candidatus Cloacimonetes bacterium]|nr:amylo-alpha-1,6-glucosidase [Candidatus Cloacimonadota bacterium]